MILDNKSTVDHYESVADWIEKETTAGQMSVVTGYFTIGALSFLSKVTNEKIDAYRFVLGDIVHNDGGKMAALNLLNENISIENAQKMGRLAKEAVAFLKLDKVSLKTLEPNFCHAKLFLAHGASGTKSYYISGSSNLTDAGLGKLPTSNVELNLVGQGTESQFKELTTWFENLWNNPQAHKEKTVYDETGKSRKVDFKQYLIDEISRLFEVYTPEQIYAKMLYELFGRKEELDPITEKQLGRLEETVVYKTLYPFQQSGVRSLIHMLNKYNGAILADAVGLGKTWSALAVMKYYQMQGSEVILLCPKKLENNWLQYQKRKNSLFEADKLDYLVRFHTDLRDGALAKKDAELEHFLNDAPKLIVIDESHNLRNDKSKRYQYLVNEILRQSKGEIKILLLSATPINNSFTDVRNQFKLMAKGDNNGFGESLDIHNLESTFQKVQTVFNEWNQEKGATLANFHHRIKDSDFFRLMDNLAVARTRKHVNYTFDAGLAFPRHKKPINIFKTPMKFGDVSNFAELLENLDLRLSAYQPSYYTLNKEAQIELLRIREERKQKGEKGVKDAILEDNVQREFFLVRMMMVLMLKRLESSWKSFHVTVKNIHKYHRDVLESIEKYKLTKENILLNEDSVSFQELEEEDESGDLDAYQIGKRNPIPISRIDEAGRLEDFTRAIKKDAKNLKHILDNVSEMADKVAAAPKGKTPDIKIQELFSRITQKQQNENKKVLIFTAYKDTAQYLQTELTRHGFERVGLATGETSPKVLEPLLQRFAPYTKLYREKQWNGFESDSKEPERYAEWQQWMATNHPRVVADLLQQPIDILIATDVLSEGQNLQDADWVVNYDIHWNPVRVVQRVGRIDRIGSPNAEIQTVNFWPSDDINEYINLRGRVEKRMAMMKLAGSEVIDQFTEDFTKLVEAEALEERQNANILLQMKESMEELDGEGTLGFDDFTFQSYRQWLQQQLDQPKKWLKAMPMGVFSGMETAADGTLPPGLVALLGYPAQTKYQPDRQYLSHELVYINHNGKAHVANLRAVLELLSRHITKDTSRHVPAAIDQGEPEAISAQTRALYAWIESQAASTETAPDGSTRQMAGDAVLSQINQLRNNPGLAVKKLKTDGAAEAKYQPANFDLLAWLIVS